ncbi:hypothetical protein CWO07_09205 [Vibrio splendidus]|uniref:Uncharacterized protein n=1 Tax=Vibrio splendidus TaxID=29497 RepID=A0A2T5EWZ6_VIBSP|nr:hypothetical protein [Vibrio splendidus]PTP36316.1 hypothetical protein CWO07_09205 [Vibrio splendidus]
MERVFTFDWDKVKPEVYEAINNGSAVIRDGVAHWAKNSGKSGVAEWLPLKQVNIDPEQLGDLSKLLLSAQTTQLAAIGLSTTFIVGAIVVQTVYLSKKIDKLQEALDLVSTEINTQNMLFYMEKMSKYFGVVESARVLLLDRSLVSETRSIADNIITQLSIERNEVLSLIDNLIGIADQATDKHLTHMLDFINLMLDMLPKAMYIESQLCDRYEKFGLSEHLMRENTKRYNQSLGKYRTWCNTKAQAVLRGENAPVALPFHEKKDELKDLFNCKHNQDLLKELNSVSIEKISA